MTRVIWMLTCAVLWWPAWLAAQAPAEKAVSSTPTQEAAIRRGIELHDQSKYDEAIAAYEAVLKESPSNATALYELAYSLVEKKDYARAIEVATRGTRYQSEELPMFFDIMASAHDSMGEPQKAIDAYTRGIAVVPDAPTLHYNMAMTYLESMKKPDEARLALERAALLAPGQPQIHLMLGQIMQDNGYPVPGLLAFATALLLEPGGKEALRAYGFMRQGLRGGVEVPVGPRDFVPVERAMRGGGPPKSASKTDEGNFAAIEERLAAAQRRFMTALDNGTPEVEALTAQVASFLSDLAAREPTRDASSFTGRFYIRYFAELQKNGYTEPFLFWSLQRAPVDGVRDWLTANEEKVREFLAWTQAYSWPQP